MQLVVYKDIKTQMVRISGCSPNFFGFPKDRFPFILLPDIKQVRVQLFVIVIYLEERTSVCINQVFCIYLKRK